MEDSIQLNLVSYPPRTAREPKPQETESDGVPQQNRRGDKRKLGESPDKTRAWPRGLQNEAKEPYKKRAPTSIISSLFNANPKLPDIKRRTVKVVQEDVFVAETFDHLNLHPYMVSNLQQTFDIKKMTAIQKAAIPCMLSKRDCLIKSQTGSGKTLAYAVPIVQMLQALEPKIKRSDGVKCIVIVPTRELAIQSYECFIKLLRPFTRIVSSYLIGGEKKKSEKSRIRKGINVLVGTPGRLLDHIETTKNLSLRDIQMLVLDEADRLLDMGYEKDIAKIIEALTNQQARDRQTVMLSATLSTGVEKLAGLTLKDPKIIDVVGNEDEQLMGKLAVPDQLRQYYVMAPGKLRLVTLAAFIFWKCKLTEEGKILIFMSTLDMVDFHNELYNTALKKALRQEEIELINNVGSATPVDDNPDEDDEEEQIEILHLHGNMSQKERTHVFLKFKDAVSGVLICTDVCARGLDLPQVHWIVQYNAPSCCTDYVHRVGRTARIGTAGNSLIFLLPSESGFVDIMVDENLSLEEIKVNSILQTLTMAFQTYKRKKHKKSLMAATMEEAATALQMRFENAVLADHELQEKARKAFLSHVRAYASYPVNLRHVFDFKALHLGHLAKSLALRETPSSLGARGSSIVKRNHRSAKFSSRPSKPMNKAPSIQQVSEFDSGLDYLPKSKKTKKGHRTL